MNLINLAKAAYHSRALIGLLCVDCRNKISQIVNKMGRTKEATDKCMEIVCEQCKTRMVEYTKRINPKTGV